MENRITQMVVGHSRHSRWHEFVHGSIVNRLTHALRTIDILIVATLGGAVKPLRLDLIGKRLQLSEFELS